MSAGLYFLRMYSVLNVTLSDLTFTDFSIKFSKKNQFEVKANEKHKTVFNTLHKYTFVYFMKLDSYKRYFVY